MKIWCSIAVKPGRNVFLLGGLALGLIWPTASASAATVLVPEQFPLIQMAIDVSVSGDTVSIAPGIYRGVGNRGIHFRGLDVVVKSREGPQNTVLDCEMADRGFYLDQAETRAARIEGITILRGYATSGFGGSGGAILCGLSDVSIVDCRFLECRAASDGGALALFVFSGIVEDCVISGCTAGWGGGISFWFGEAEIKDCVITGNKAAYYAGGVCFGGQGGNRLSGCTVAANSCDNFGGGIYAANPLLLERCIVWDNCAVSYGPEILCGEADIRCSDIDTTGVFGVGVSYDENCVFTDPLFCSPTSCELTINGDWSLGANSSCLPEHSPCGQLIGAVGLGCGGSDPSGACCLPDGSCQVLQESDCESEHGSYMGDGTACEPNPCQPVPVEVTTWGRVKTRFR